MAAVQLFLSRQTSSTNFSSRTWGPVLRNFPVDIFTHTHTRGHTHTLSFLIYTSPRRATVFLLCGPTPSLKQKRFVSERHACKYRSNAAYWPHLTGHDRIAAVLVGSVRAVFFTGRWKDTTKARRICDNHRYYVITISKRNFMSLTVASRIRRIIIISRSAAATAVAIQNSTITGGEYRLITFLKNL